jgi:hypothetical protein
MVDWHPFAMSQVKLGHLKCFSFKCPFEFWEIQLFSIQMLRKF